MIDSVVSVEDLSKRYLIGHRSAERDRYATLRDVIGRESHNFLRKASDLFHGKEIVQGDEVEEFWALQAVNFEVKQGEVLGIIGKNGAGKSTLLKILSRITEPSRGRVTLRGRIASLLEVGTGFHPELTGRENIFLNGAILGMRRAEIKRKFDEIVAFAEVEEFLDTPVKRYSSGMYVRLAFAVAAHLEPEVLVVDEVLAVGDAQFQKKCLGKMHDVARNDGRTVLFVSHNMVAVRSLCQRCLVLAQGRLVHDGPAEEGIATYLEEMLGHSAEQVWHDPAVSPGNEIVKIARIAIKLRDPHGVQQITMRSPFRIEIDYLVQKPMTVLHVMFHLYNERGVLVLTSSARAMVHEAAVYRSTCEVSGGLLNEGAYVLKLQVIKNNEEIIYVHENITSFQVIDTEPRTEGWMGREPGVVQPVFPWRTQKVDVAEQRGAAPRSQIMN
jgi:lipopolysaccharide transport system ATP-binding protein